MGVTLRCSEPKQSPRLGIVLRPMCAAEVHAAEYGLRLCLALLCSKLYQPPRLYRIFAFKCGEPLFAHPPSCARVGARINSEASVPTCARVAHLERSNGVESVTDGPSRSLKEGYNQRKRHAR